MERLVSTSQAAQILGLSLQGIHYRIKNNQLKSLKRSGKTYVYISDYLQEQTQTKQENVDDTNKVLEVKDEQIELLKESMSWMKNQYKDEIERLEKNQKRIIKVFKSEIQLLQNAFNEMRTIYKTENKQLSSNKIDFTFMSVSDFFILMKKYNKTDRQIKILILNRIKNKDKRFIFKKETKELFIFEGDYSDLI
ncbi:MAG: DNA-binding protein [Campylobacteraceae bacterium]|nr:DNA-binding protein [Campylobacteraceae bacterium]